MIVIDDDDDDDDEEADNDSSSSNQQDNENNKIYLLESISKVITASISSTEATDSSKLMPTCINSSKKLEDVISKLTTRVGNETVNEVMENNNALGEENSTQSSIDESSDSTSLESKQIETISSVAYILSDSNLVNQNTTKGSICNDKVSSEPLMTDSEQNDESMKESSLTEISINSQITDIKSLKKKETKVNVPASLVDTLQNADTQKNLEEEASHKDNHSSLIPIADKDNHSCDEVTPLENQQEIQILSSSSTQSEKYIEKPKTKTKRVSRNDTCNIDIKNNKALMTKTYVLPKKQKDTTESSVTSDSFLPLKARRSRPRTTLQTAVAKNKMGNLAVDTFIPAVPLPPRRHE